jgi:glycosyltransferase involved in cell wall biosynthesis
MRPDSNDIMPNCRDKLSAIVITLNEEKRLGRCLDSVEWMDEIVVVDSGSKDGTCDLARRYTEMVFHRHFADYASQKNYGVSKASYKWIFSIDADEVMPPSLRAEIEKILSEEPKQEIFVVSRENVYFGHSVKHVMGRDEPVRLFRRKRGHFEGPVHEKVVGGSIGRLNSPLLHYSCDTYHEWVQKHRRYVRMDAERQFRQGRRFSWGRYLLSPWRTFLYRFGVLKGWKDGWAGLAIAFEMSLSMLLLQMELKYLAKKQNEALS